MIKLQMYGIAQSKSRCESGACSGSRSWFKFNYRGKTCFSPGYVSMSRSWSGPLLKSWSWSGYCPWTVSGSAFTSTEDL